MNRSLTESQFFEFHAGLRLKQVVLLVRQNVIEYQLQIVCGWQDVVDWSLIFVDLQNQLLRIGDFVRGILEVEIIRFAGRNFRSIEIHWHRECTNSNRICEEIL